MHRLISNKMTILALGLALILAAGGVATASKMGFKVKKTYGMVPVGATASSLSYLPVGVEGKLNTIGLPQLYSWRNVGPAIDGPGPGDLQDGAHLRAVLNEGDTDGTLNCTRVVHLFPNYPANESWNGPGGAIFPVSTPIALGSSFGRVEDGFLVGIDDTDHDGTADVSERITQFIVGSHNDTALSLSHAEPDVNFKSLPYHGIYLDGASIFNAINAANPPCANGDNACTRVCHIFPNFPAQECWNGPSPAIFPIVPGEAYVIGVCRPLVWTPEHY